jgi:hypothetical protein
MSVIHFNGKFIFHMPGYNNHPKNDTNNNRGKDKFDADRPVDKVKDLCACDPEHYFEFYFRNVRVSQVTYRDGTSAVEDDSILGQRVLLNGLLVDVSPSAIGGQLFANGLKVGNLLTGRLTKALQSDLRMNLRPLDSPVAFSDESAAAHFEMNLEVIDNSSPEESRCLRELNGVSQLEIYIHLNRYTRWDTEDGRLRDRLNGDIYGYIRPRLTTDTNELRIKGRRLVAHPEIENTPEMKRIFLGSTSELIRRTDIDGTYDIFKADHLLMLHYLDFVPFLDRCYNTPTDRASIKEYIVFFTDKHEEELIEVGRFKGDYNEMRHTGGIIVFQLPNAVLNRDDLMLIVKVVYKDAQIPLMIESKWDLVLENDRGHIIPSGGLADIVARVFYLNRPAPGTLVRLQVQPEGKEGTRNANVRSPIVAKWKSDKRMVSDPDGTVSFLATSDVNGLVTAAVEAVNLENVQSIYDPVIDKDLEGNLPWDRYYGNYIYMEIDNPLRKFQRRHVEQIEIPIRVLHVVKEDMFPAKLSFKEHIFPYLLRYYVRYFPWLHTSQDEKGHGYNQFLNLESYDDVSKKLGRIIDYLSLDDNNWYKMPRSRDFPINGLQLIKRWQEQGMPQ